MKGPCGCNHQENQQQPSFPMTESFQLPPRCKGAGQTHPRLCRVSMESTHHIMHTAVGGGTTLHSIFCDRCLSHHKQHLPMIQDLDWPSRILPTAMPRCQTCDNVPHHLWDSGHPSLQMLTSCWDMHKVIRSDT